MYKHFFIALLFASSIACTAETKKTEFSEDKLTSTAEVREIEIPEAIKEEVETSTMGGKEATIEKIIEDKVEGPIEAKTDEITEVKKETTVESETEEVKPEPIEPIAYSPSHSAFDALLKKYVTTSGKVNYAGFKTEKAKLDSYLALLSKNTPATGWNKNEKLAYWINLYNAGTIQLILKNYPTKSIMNINSGKAWDLKFVKSGKETLSLNQIENEIIRPTFKEPRIHFAVNCAANSCPKLLNGAFLPHKLEAQLELATKKFINNKSKNNVAASSIKISKIFEWYGADFGGSQKLITYFNKYSTIKIDGSAKISFMEYNWDLNK